VKGWSLVAKNNKQQATMNQWQLQHWGGPSATVLGPQHRLKVAAMALLCHGNSSITLLWQ